MTNDHLHLLQLDACVRTLEQCYLDAPRNSNERAALYTLYRRLAEISAGLNGETEQHPGTDPLTAIDNLKAVARKLDTLTENSIMTAANNCLYQLQP